MAERPAGKGWKPVEFSGGPRDGSVAWHGGPDNVAPLARMRMLDPSNDPMNGVHAGDTLHVYKFRRFANGVERYEYQGTEKAGA